MSSLSDHTKRFASARPGRLSVPVFAQDAPLRRGLRLRGRRLMRFIEQVGPLRAGQGSVLALSFIVGGWFYGAAIGGHGPAVLSGVAASFGLKATDIVLSGQVETSEADIFAALGLSSGDSLVGFSANDARERLKALPWIRDVAIRKLYPGKLQVSLVEKQAMAVWQLHDRLTVVEQTGSMIAKFGIADLINNRFAHLPHLVGEGAASKARDILPLAARHPQIAGRVKAYVRVADRRWDIQLNNGTRIKLPEYGVGMALKRLSDLQDDSRVLEREIAVVDMRLDDRIVFGLEEVAAKTRAELVAARLKAMKKADQKL